LTSSNDIVEGDSAPIDNGRETTPVEPSQTDTKKRTRARKPRLQPAAEPNGATAISWKHDPEKWGMPKQEWTTATNQWCRFNYNENSANLILNGLSFGWSS